MLLTMLMSVGRAEGIGGAVGATSDDVFRGVSQNDGAASLQADLHYVKAQWYGGLSVEAVKRAPEYEHGVEVIVYAGYQRQLSESWNGALVMRRYNYPEEAGRFQFNYYELGASLAWRARFVMSVTASPDTYYAAAWPRFGTAAAYCYEVTARQPLPQALSASAGLGYYDLHRQVGAGYSYWSAALGRQWRSWDIDLRYVGTDATARHLFGNEAGDRLVLTALWSF